MVDTHDGENRGGRRRARTRAALVAAARELLARANGAEASIQEITELADVGFGSFYNHFATKAELFGAAIAETLEEHGAMLDDLTADIDDPAEVFATGVRITARLPTTHPQMARIICHTGHSYLTAETGLAPRALRDILAARDAGRFTVDDPAVALACVGGALLGVLNLVGAARTRRAVDRAADQLAHNLLRMFEVPREDAERICARKLPAPRRPPAEHRRARQLAERRGSSVSAVITELTARGLNQLDEPLAITIDDVSGFKGDPGRSQGHLG